MKHTALAATLLAATATTATAGGIDRSGQSIAPLFEDGSYVELSFGYVTPDISGTVESGTVSSGNMAASYSQVSGAIKFDITDKLSFAAVVDQPYGADVNYSESDPGYRFSGSTATITSTALNAILRYKISDRFAVHGGLRQISTHGEVGIPDFGYTLDTSTESDTGYLVGASYEIPDIALRASLTYNSAVDVNFTTVEVGFLPGTMEVTLPQSVNLDFQTGIAADTLLIASARWVDWSEFNISPSQIPNLVDYDDDTISYTLGIGRRFNDKLSGSILVGYEAATGGTSGNLGPTDGNSSISVGAKYQVTDATAISGGVRYVWIGDTTTTQIAADFSDNSAVGLGLKLSHSF